MRENDAKYGYDSQLMEDLEQLKVLENGHRIKVIQVHPRHLPFLLKINIVHFKDVVFPAGGSRGSWSGRAQGRSVHFGQDGRAGHPVSTAYPSMCIFVYQAGQLAVQECKKNNMQKINYCIRGNMEVICSCVFNGVEVTCEIWRSQNLIGACSGHRAISDFSNTDEATEASPPLFTDAAIFDAQNCCLC